MEHNNEDDIEEGQGSKTISLEHIVELSDEDVKKLQFIYADAADEFYNAYARAKGFSIRKDEMYAPNDQIISRQRVCSRAGKRAHRDRSPENKKLETRALTRISYETKFRIRYVKLKGKYVVTKFFNNHNHDMVNPPGAHFLLSHRRLTSSDNDITKAMYRVGVSPCNIMNFFAELSGGHENIGFTYSDLCSAISNERQKIFVDGDAEGAIGYLAAKKEADPLFYYTFDNDSEGHLIRLFWLDSISRADFVCFGGVLVFDTTYRTNFYRMLFVILQGVNNRFQTIIFGCALLAADTTESYTWLLRKFLDAMEGKHPLSIITDGDQAMRSAIATVFPSSHNRLCVWHLERNVTQNIHIKGFHERFQSCMSMIYCIEAFDEAWQKLVSDFKLEDNHWAIEVYTKCQLWAEACLQGKFFAGMRNTQRCEGMNANFKCFLKPRLQLYEVVETFDMGIRAIREKSIKAKTECESSESILTTGLRAIEKHASKIYTHAKAPEKVPSLHNLQTMRSLYDMVATLV